MEMSKTKKYSIRAGVTLALLWLLIASAIFAVTAATGNGATGNGMFGWTWGTNNDNKNAKGSVTDAGSSHGESQGTLILKVAAWSSTYSPATTGCNASAEVPAQATTNTVTVTNNSGATLRIVNITSTNATCTVRGLKVGETLAKEGAFSISIEAVPSEATSTESKECSDTVTIVYSVVQNVEVTFYGADNASYVRGGVTLDSVEAKANPETFESGSNLTLPSAPQVTSGKFYGWRLSYDGSLHDPGKVIEVKDTTSVYPVIAEEGLIKPFSVNGVDYHFWSEAVAVAVASGKSIVLNQKEYTLPTTMAANGVHPSVGSKYVTGSDGDIHYIVPSKVVFLIPFDDAYTLYTTTPAYAGAYSKPEYYCTLIMPRGAHITVNGEMSLSGKHCSVMGQNGAPVGPVAHVEMLEGSSITVSTGCALYAWGYITGKGTVVVESGGSVYEDFQVTDWRGGSATSGMVDNDERVFPVSQYYIQNIEVPLKLEAGAKEFVCMTVEVSSQARTVVVPFVSGGGTNAMFRIHSGSMTKYYDGSKDRMCYTVEGAVDLYYFSITIEGMLGLGNTILNTSNYFMPLNGNISVTVKEKASIKVLKDFQLLPGVEITIEPNASVIVGDGVKVVAYDADQWGTYCYDNVLIKPVKYAPGQTCATRSAATVAELADVQIIVNGTLDASAGQLYVTSGGANICSTGEGKVIVGAATTAPGFYQASQSGTNITYPSVSIVNAKLKNENDSYVETSSATSKTTYIYAHYDCTACKNEGKCGKWVAGGHNETTTTTDATCLDAGSTSHVCSCGHSCVDILPALGHSWAEQSMDGNVYTCECNRGCGTDIALTVEYRLEDYLWFNGYTAQNFLVGDGVTVSENVQTVVSNGKRYFVRAIPADEIPNDLTFTVSVSGGTATFTVSLADYQIGLGENHKYYDLCDKLIKYGNAYVDYKDDDENLTSGTLAGNPFGENNTTLVVQSQFDPSQAVGGIRVITSGAKVYFDEALRLSVLYEMNGTLNGYTIVQVGLLVGDGTSELTTEAFVAAYLAYDATQNKVGLVPNLPKDNGTLIQLNDNASFTNPSTIPTSGELTFDLTSLQYSQSLSLRPVFVLTDGTNYYCVYGRQVKYGLAEYINAKYADTKTTNEYRYLLETVWAVALEAQKAFGG